MKDLTNSGTPKARKLSMDLIEIIIGATVYAGGTVLSLMRAPVPVQAVAFAASLIISGRKVFASAFKNIIHGKLFDENFLMSIATAAAFSIGCFEEGAAVMLLSRVGEYFEDLASDRSTRSISGLMELRPEKANLVTVNGTIETDPRRVPVGSVIEIRPGEKVPLDGAVINGRSFVDTSMLTGEPVPKEVNPGSNISAGFINRGSLIRVRVGKSFGESSVSKIISLMHTARERKAKAENFITRFSHIYTPIVTSAALAIAIFPPLLMHAGFYPWIYRAIVFLVVSCPCALVISVPLGFFAGIGAAASNGILFKGGNYLEALAGVGTVVFDKTGTLTKGVFEVTGILPEPGISSSDVLMAAAAAESASNHPIAKSILRAAGKKNGFATPVSFREYPGMGCRAEYEDFTCSAGNAALLKSSGIDVGNGFSKGACVFVEKSGKYLGKITISDIIKPDSKPTVLGLRKNGVSSIAMLTGDGVQEAEAVAHEIGITDVRAGLLPDGKVSEFEKIRNESRGNTAFLGDGINDAPVLARADIGIAMGGLGADTAVEAADIVIMDDMPSRILTGLKISRYVKKIVTQNITAALTVKFAVLVLGAFGHINIWMAVFADTGVALLAVLNSMRTLFFRKKFR